MSGGNDDDRRLSRQMAFIVEIDRLKHVLRRSLTGSEADQRRRENSAEHSWHLALMAVLLAEHAEGKIDASRAVKMVLVHDLVEIDAGDTYCYDERAGMDKEERERCAADRIFAMLPEDQTAEMRGLWDEFEARRTPEAKFANAIDRLQPVMLNYYSQGQAWRENGVTSDRVLARNRAIEEGSAGLWAFARGLIEDAVMKGYLKK
jgi:putative hydrolase of HD superfamily